MPDPSADARRIRDLELALKHERLRSTELQRRNGGARRGDEARVSDGARTGPAQKGRGLTPCCGIGEPPIVVPEPSYAVGFASGGHSEGRIGLRSRQALADGPVSC